MNFTPKLSYEVQPSDRPKIMESSFYPDTLRYVVQLDSKTMLDEEFSRNSHDVSAQLWPLPPPMGRGYSHGGDLFPPSSRSDELPLLDGPQICHSQQYSADSVLSLSSLLLPKKSENRRISKPRITTTFWEDEATTCFQVRDKNVVVSRREKDDYINGTKLLNVTGMSRGRRDGILKTEKGREVVRTGSMNLKGVWIPFGRAVEIARNEGVDDVLYPLFVKNLREFFEGRGLELRQDPALEDEESDPVPSVSPDMSGTMNGIIGIGVASAAETRTFY